MEMQYIMFILGSADAPQPDYESKKEKNKEAPKSAQDEINAISSALG